MSTDLNTLKPLNDFPKTSYEKSVASTGVKMRWIGGQCFQIKLPDGKVLLTDPIFPQNPTYSLWRNESTPVFNPDDLGQVDYVTINHPHFDHMDSLPDVFARSKPLVICDAIFARDLSAQFKIPSHSVFPINTGMSYRFDSFKLDTFPGRHNDLADTAALEDTEKMLRMVYSEEELPSVRYLNSYGSIMNTNFLFTLTNNFRIGFASGVEIGHLAHDEAWKRCAPNLLLRQKMIFAKADEFAKECVELGGQLAMLMHHDAWLGADNDVNAYCQEANAILSQRGSNMRIFNQQRLKWHTISMTVSTD